MASNAIVPLGMPNVPAPETISAVELLVRKAVQSGMAKTKRPEDAFFIVMYGLELGIPPMTALRTIYSVNGGAPTCSGEAMLALIRRSGKVQVKITSTEDTLKAGKATVYMKRLDTGDEFTATWGKTDDERAGLRSNRDKYPAQMWTWRAVSIAGKALCSDIIGALYTFEEINPQIPVDESGAPIGDIGDVEEGDFTEEPAEDAPRPKWATPENLDVLKDILAKNDIQWSDIPGLTEVISDPANWQQWEAFATSGKSAVQGLIGLRNQQLEKTAATFTVVGFETRMGTVRGKEQPVYWLSTEDGNRILAYGRTGLFDKVGYSKDDMKNWDKPGFKESFDEDQRFTVEAVEAVDPATKEKFWRFSKIGDVPF